MKQLEVKILHQTFHLSCPEGQEERLLSAVRKVDAAMTSIRDASKARTREHIAILAAVNVAFDLIEKQTTPPLPIIDLAEEIRWRALLSDLDEVLDNEDLSTTTQC